MANDPRRKNRRGLLSVELLFVFPILLILLLGVVEFSLFLGAQQRVDLAAREGARVAATGGTLDDVNAIVSQVLGPNRFAAATVVADINDPSGNPLPSGSPVAVTVSLPAGAVVPDLLVFIGLSIRDQQIVSRIVMRKE